MLEKIDFGNIEKKPLGELVFLIKEDGVQLKVPALNERWVQGRSYTKYRSLVGSEGQVMTGADLDEWLNEAQWFKKDMEYLLELRHFKFWSHLIFEKKCMEAITSFLQEACPFYIDLQSLISDPQVLIIYSEILQCVLRIICRMITNKEAEEEWITMDHLKELLYSKYLISIPMIFDLIMAYGRSNINILSKIIQTIFKIEPKYNNDLRIGVQYLQKAFKIIQKKSENEGMENDNGPISSFYDLALYSLDCASTLSILLEVYPEARTICCEIHLEQSITNFYDNTISLLYKNIFTINPSCKSLEYLNRTRIELIKAFRSLLNVYIENILKNPKQSLASAENYIAILTECLADRTFVVDYQKYFPVESDIDILKQACKELDQFKANFVLKAYTSEGESYLVDMAENNDIEEPEVNSLPEATNGLENDIQNLRVDVPERDMEKEVNAVLDVLPYLGGGFVRRLLQRYDNTEQAISAVLESNLPPDLVDADQEEIYIPPDPQDIVFRQTGVRRINVFDGDKYDIMTHDNPECVIKTGKGFPGQPKNVNQLLNDKTYVKEMKEKYQEYTLVSDNEYDDEYDDSYEALADSEAKTAKFKRGQNVIVDEIADEESDEEDESDDDVQQAKEQDKGKAYLENPADIRARYEAYRLAKANSRGGARNVVGKTKGQGQEKDVLINRQKKEVNKSSRANHNRKSGAAFKRSRGMLPF